jgi:hypothetical protein
MVTEAGAEVESARPQPNTKNDILKGLAEMAEAARQSGATDEEIQQIIGVEVQKFVKGQPSVQPEAVVEMRAGKQIIKEPLLEDEFLPMLVEFQANSGITDPVKAAKMLAKGLADVGVDPYTHLDEAKMMAQKWNQMRDLIKGGPLTEGAFDAAGAVVAKEVAKKVMFGPGKGTTDDKMERLMDKYMPYKIVMEMMSGMPTRRQQSDGEDSEVKKLADRVDKFIESQKETERDKKFEERFSKLEAMIGAKKPTEEDAMLRELRELKESFKEGKGKSEVTEKIDALTKAITEKREADKFDTLKDQITSIKSGLEDKIANLQGSINQGAPKKDVMDQATELMSTYNKLMDMAKTFGLESKDEKVTGDLRKDLIKLGKDIVGVMGKAVEHRGEAPPRLPVQQLPASAVIPLGPQQLQQPKQPRQPMQPAPAQPAQPETILTPEEASPTTNEARYQQEVLAVAPFAKKPKPAEVPVEVPATTPVETPTEAPAEVPPETAGSSEAPGGD